MLTYDTHTGIQEGTVVETTDFDLTQELHVIRAHQMHYFSLLEDLKKTVNFVQETANPALESLTDKEREFTVTLMKRERENLLGEVDRLEKERDMQESRLRNVMHLVFYYHYYVHASC